MGKLAWANKDKMPSVGGMNGLTKGLPEKFLAVLIIIFLCYLDLEKWNISANYAPGIIIKQRGAHSSNGFEIAWSRNTDPHGDVTEFLVAIIVSLETHVQIVACFSEIVPQ